MRVPNTIVLPDGRRVVCRIFDTGPDGPIDRYTVAFKALRSHRGPLYFPYLAANCAPFHPLGFGQHGEADRFLTGRHLGRRVHFDALPRDVQRFILMQFTDNTPSPQIPLPLETT
jgi:hypothetical protein